MSFLSKIMCILKETKPMNNGMHHLPKKPLSLDCLTQCIKNKSTQSLIPTN